MKEKVVAYCGFLCSDCGAYIATMKNDDKLRQVQADKWSKQYNQTVAAKDINCVGCISDGPKIDYCVNCEIRKCALEKSIVNCGYCATYPCAKLDIIFKHAPATKKTLDENKKRKN